MHQVSISLVKSPAQGKLSFIKMVLAVVLVSITTVFCKLAAGLAVMNFWYERSQTRLRLGDLEEWQLKDVGLTKEKARQEVAKSFWQD